jgi:endoglucanase
MVSHYTATWMPENEFESFDNPHLADDRCERRFVEQGPQPLIDLWVTLVDQGIAIHVGERRDKLATCKQK